MKEADPASLPNPWKAFFLSFLFSAIGLALLLLSDRGTEAWRRSAREARELHTEIATLTTANAKLAARLEDARQSDYELERIARESLSLVRPDEVVFLLPEEPAAQAPTARRASAAGAGRASK